MGLGDELENEKELRAPSICRYWEKKYQRLKTDENANDLLQMRDLSIISPLNYYNEDILYL